MTTPLAVTFVYQWTRDMPHRDISAAREYARFIDELGGHAASPIQTIDQLRDAPTSHFIVFAGADVRVSLNECPIDQQPTIARRLIPINASRPKIFETLLEPLSLAATSDDLSMLEWKISAPEQTGTRGLHGLHDVGKMVGAGCLIFQSERYCFLVS